MSRRLVTDADRDRFVRLFSAGMTCSSIAARCGWCAETVRRALASRGVHGFGKPGPEPLSGPAVDRIVALHTKKGLGAAEIVRMVGRPHMTVTRILRRAGVYRPGIARDRKRRMVRDAIEGSEVETGRRLCDADYWRSSACMLDLRLRMHVLVAHGASRNLIASVLGVSAERVRAIMGGRPSLRAPSWANERDPTEQEIADRAREIRAQRPARRAS